MSNYISGDDPQDEYVLLTEVPKKYYYKTQNTPKPIRWHVQYNVAAWLRLSRSCQEPVSLIITYQDSVRIKEAIVEVYLGHESQFLLSGIGTLLPIGPITSMSIELKGIPEDVTVKIDELYIQKVQKENGNTDQSPLRFTLRA